MTVRRPQCPYPHDRPGPRRPRDPPCLCRKPEWVFPLFCTVLNGLIAFDVLIVAALLILWSCCGGGMTPNKP